MVFPPPPAPPSDFFKNDGYKRILPQAPGKQTTPNKTAGRPTLPLPNFVNNGTFNPGSPGGGSQSGNDLSAIGQWFGDRGNDIGSWATGLGNWANQGGINPSNDYGIGPAIFDSIQNPGKRAPSVDNSGAPSNGSNGAFHWPAGDEAFKFSAPDGTNASPQEQSILDILLEKLNQKYQAPDPTKIDFTALDNALKTRTGQLDGAEQQVRGNFDKSDLAIEQMHRAFENQVRTSDAASYNSIADQNKSGLTGNMNNAVGSMEASRAKASAERTAMLKALGQEQAAQAPDPNAAIFDQGIATAQTRNNSDQVMADGKRANNLAYNNTVAESIGQAGVQRRSALQSQLQQLLGKVSLARSDAQANDQQQRQAAISNVNSNAYKAWNDDQDRMAGLFDTISNQQSREGIANQRYSSTGGAKPTGMNAVTRDLAAGFSPQQAALGIAALNKVLSGGNYLEGANGSQRDSSGNIIAGTSGTVAYDRIAELAKKLKNEGVPEDVATATAISFGKNN